MRVKFQIGKIPAGKYSTLEIPKGRNSNGKILIILDIGHNFKSWHGVRRPAKTLARLDATRSAQQNACVNLPKTDTTNRFYLCSYLSSEARSAKNLANQLHVIPAQE